MTEWRWKYRNNLSPKKRGPWWRGYVERGSVENWFENEVIIPIRATERFIAAECRSIDGDTFMIFLLKVPVPDAFTVGLEAGRLVAK